MALPIRNNDKFDLATLVADVKEHARTYYNNGRGWDIVVECWTDEEIAECIGKCTSKYGARNRVYRAVKVVADYRKEVRAAGDADAEAELAQALRAA